MIGPLLLRNGIRRLFCISAVGASLPCLPLRNVNFGSDYDDGYAFDVQIHELQVQKHLRHAPEVKKRPERSDLWADSGTFGLRHEPCFGYKRLKRLAGLCYKIAVKNTENINTNSGIKHQIAITKNLCFCLQIFAFMLI